MFKIWFVIFLLQCDFGSRLRASPHLVLCDCGGCVFDLVSLVGHILGFQKIITTTTTTCCHVTHGLFWFWVFRSIIDCVFGQRDMGLTHCSLTHIHSIYFTHSHSLTSIHSYPFTPIHSHPFTHVHSLPFTPIHSYPFTHFTHFTHIHSYPFTHIHSLTPLTPIHSHPFAHIYIHSSSWPVRYLQK